MALLTMLGIGSAMVQSCNHTSDVKPAASETKSSSTISNEATTLQSGSRIIPQERETVIINNKAHLQDIQRVIALGLLDVSINSTFAGVVNQLTNSNAATGYDWYTSFTQIQSSYPSLVSAMQSSLLAHGGTSDDANLLNSSLLGFSINGVDFTPGVRLSYKDGTKTVTPVHVVATTQLYPQSSIPAWTYNGSAYEFNTLGNHTLVGQQTWTVNLMLDEGEESNTLYTSQAERLYSGEGRCRTSRLTGACWSDGTDKRCKCSGGYDGDDDFSVSSL